MSTPIAIKTATPEDASAIAHIQIAGWRAAYQDIVPDSHLNSLSASDKTAFWQRILIDPVKAKDILVARSDDNNNNNDSSDQTVSQVLGFVSFGSAGDRPGPGSDVAKLSVEASRRGELRAIYVDPRHLSEGVGRCLWTAAQARMVELGYSTVVVWVFAGNERAIRFYRKAGFSENQTGQTEVGGVTVATIQLAKTL